MGEETDFHPVCILATIDGDQPRVRGFFSLLFDDEKIYFTTAATKSVYKQISQNRKVELCSLSQNFSRMLRITGEFEIVDDRDKKQTLIEEKPYLKGFTTEDNNFILLRISHGFAHFWTIENNLKENEIVVIKF